MDPFNMGVISLNTVPAAARSGNKIANSFTVPKVRLLAYHELTGSYHSAIPRTCPSAHPKHLKIDLQIITSRCCTILVVQAV